MATKTKPTEADASLASVDQNAPAPAITLPMDFRKKPIVIQALKWTGDNLADVIQFTDGRQPETRGNHAGMMWDDYVALVRAEGLKIFTLEGEHLASIGDWIIRGVQGEFYPCKPDIFAATYDAAETEPAPTDPVIPEVAAPATIEGVDALLQRLSDADRETLLAKWGVLWIAGGLPEGAQADRDAALEAAASVVDLARLLDEVGARTAGMTGGIVGPGLRRFLEAEGAEISEDDPATVTLGGITASSQFGLSRALLDWCMVATRKIMAGAV